MNYLTIKLTQTMPHVIPSLGILNNANNTSTTNLSKRLYSTYQGEITLHVDLTAFKTAALMMKRGPH